MAGGRLATLRPFTADDIAPPYLSWLNDPETMRFSRHRHHRHDEESCRRYLQTFAGTDNLFLAIDERGSGRMLGTMTAYIDRERATADMGLLVGERAVWGRGIGGDAWSTLMAYLLGRCGLRTVTGGTLAGNLGMRRIMEKSGMRLREVREAPEGHEVYDSALIYVFPHADD